MKFHCSVAIDRLHFISTDHHRCRLAFSCKLSKPPTPSPPLSIALSIISALRHHHIMPIFVVFGLFLHSAYSRCSYTTGLVFSLHIRVLRCVHVRVCVCVWHKIFFSEFQQEYLDCFGFYCCGFICVPCHRSPFAPILTNILFLEKVFNERRKILFRAVLCCRRSLNANANM